MTKYIKGKDGKFAGSIGDGKTSIPASVSAPVSAATGASVTPAKPTIHEIHATYLKVGRERYNTAIGAVTNSVTEQFPTAHSFSLAKVQDPDAILDGSDYVELGMVLDAQGNALYERYRYTPEPDSLYEVEFLGGATSHELAVKTDKINKLVEYADDIERYEDPSFSGLTGDDDVQVSLFPFTIDSRN
jgi:hypothetical protein